MSIPRNRFAKRIVIPSVIEVDLILIPSCAFAERFRYTMKLHAFCGLLSSEYSRCLSKLEDGGKDNTKTSWVYV